MASNVGAHWLAAQILLDLHDVFAGSLRQVRMKRADAPSQFAHVAGQSFRYVSVHIADDAPSQFVAAQSLDKAPSRTGFAADLHRDVCGRLGLYAREQLIMRIEGELRQVT